MRRLLPRRQQAVTSTKSRKSPSLLPYKRWTNPPILAVAPAVRGQEWRCATQLRRAVSGEDMKEDLLGKVSRRLLVGLALAATVCSAAVPASAYTVRSQRP